MAKSAYMATKQVLTAYAKEQRKGGHSFSFNPEKVYRGGEDPGGWSRPSALACIITEGSDLPNEYNHHDPLAAWSEIEEKVEALYGKPVFFEPINSCVVALYAV